MKPILTRLIIVIATRTSCYSVLTQTHVQDNKTEHPHFFLPSQVTNFQHYSCV